MKKMRCNRIYMRKIWIVKESSRDKSALTSSETRDRPMCSIIMQISGEVPVICQGLTLVAQILTDGLKFNGVNNCVCSPSFV